MRGTIATIAIGFLALMLVYGIYAFRDRRAKLVAGLLLIVLVVILLTPGVRNQIWSALPVQSLAAA